MINGKQHVYTKCVLLHVLLLVNALILIIFFPIYMYDVHYILYIIFWHYSFVKWNFNHCKK